MFGSRKWAGTAVAAVLLWSGAQTLAVAGDAEQVSAAEAKTHASESWVMLEGHIVQSMGDELYRFEDSSGEILVRIGPEDWQGQNVRKDTRVKVHGQLKKRGDHMEVKADRVTVED